MRALLIVLDSVGIGNAPDAAKYGDEGANTLRHIFEKAPELRLLNLDSLGLGAVVAGGGDPGDGKTAGGGGDHARRTGVTPPGYNRPLASYGKMQERSPGKDTTTGHWELAGVVLDEPFAVFEKFPIELVRAIEQEAGVQFIGNYPRSGTQILDELGPEHLRTGHPILYTSADSVLQIAAHESVVPIARLYDICEIARKRSNPYRIGRVIARPFEGEPGKFRRTSRRHDYSMRPPRTVLNAIRDSGRDVIGVGKINDIFAGEGITETHPTTSNSHGMETMDKLWPNTSNGLIFVNLVDFDMVYGHRRDIAGYAKALNDFDNWLGKFRAQVSPDDLVIITADHGNDPTFRGTDHTREQVPLLVMHQGASGNLGTRQTFADVAASLAEFFQLAPWPVGDSFLNR